MTPLPFEGFWSVARRFLGRPLGNVWTIARLLARRARGKADGRGRSNGRGRALLCLGAMLVAFLLVEVAGRILFPGLRLNLGGTFHRSLGWTQSPGGRWSMEIEGEAVRNEFNLHGFRDVEHEIAKPAGVRRLVVLGDSFTEALQVNLGDTYAKLLEKKLNEGGEERWETIVLAVADWGTAQEWIALEEYGFAYGPDVVLCQVFPMNDVCNNSVGLCDLCESDNDRLRPYFVERDGRLVLTSAHPRRTFLRRNLLSYGLIEWGLWKLWGPPVTDHEWRMERLGALGHRRLDPLINAFSREEDQIRPVAEGWRITERILEEMARSCRTRGVALCALVLPHDQHVGKGGEDLDASLRGATRWKDGDAVALPDVDYPERRLEAFFRRAGIPLARMKPVFDRHAEEVLPSRSGHLNSAGHRLTAEALFALFRDAGIAR
ncbi:MAG: hypothetical protein ACREIU_12500 [Planctomycetota bacterium]